LRKKSKILVAFGSCAQEGGIPGLANFTSREALFDTVYDSPSTNNADGIRPQRYIRHAEGQMHHARVLPGIKTLDQVIDVDYYMPGCPPESHQIAAVIDLVIAGAAGSG
jgi:F420-non-reducing hydrogenase small subunit